MEIHDFVFHATENPVTGEITVERDPPIDGAENIFIFSSKNEMWLALSQVHPAQDVEEFMKTLDAFGSAHFESGLAKPARKKPASSDSVGKKRSA